MRNVLTELLYSAILWGSLITALFWWLRRRTRSRTGRLALAVPLAWFAVHTLIAWYGVLIPISGRLVDADSGKPIAKARVIAVWMSYPMDIWKTYCSGSQAHLTGENGRFYFPLAPYPTLLAGTLMRGLNPRVPGRINHRSLKPLPAPVWGDIHIQVYAHGRSTSRSGPNTGCHVTFAPQYDNYLQVLEGESAPFEVMYREACIEKQRWGRTDQFIRDMMITRPGRNSPDSPPPRSIQEALRSLESTRCSEGGACVTDVPEQTREQFCEYFKTIREPTKEGV